MTPDHAKILKLSSGEEIICNVETLSDKSTINVVAPMKVVAVPKITRNGIEESLTLQRWIHFSEKNVYTVAVSQIITVADASHGLTRFYDWCVNKMNREEEDVLPPSDKQLRQIEEEEHQDELDDWNELYGEPLSKVYH